MEWSHVCPRTGKALWIPLGEMCDRCGRDSEPVSIAAVANHPNRSKASPSLAANPTPEQIRAAREAQGLTQTQAGAVIYCTLRAWQEWESGSRRMHPAFWELWRIKLGLDEPI